MLLTKYSGAILGPIAVVLGVIMDAIFRFCNTMSIPNIGLCIILFTIAIYLLLMPLTIKQQKFSKLSAKMNPELQAIQKKYKGKQDQVSMMKQNEETKAVYAKYGVSPAGSCLQMMIQMPILFALYRVIWNIPAYVSGIKDAFIPLAEKIVGMGAEGQAYLADFANANRINFDKIGFTVDSVIDCLYKFKPTDWNNMASDASFSNVSKMITDTQQSVDHMNNFLGINIANSPATMFKEVFTPGNFSLLILIGALAIPVLAGLTQWLNMKLMPTADTSSMSPNGEGGSMADSMKMMNNVMPLMSVVFCFTLPAGMGIYWIAGAVVRSIQQVIVNKHIDKMDIDAVVKKNLEKENKKREKMGLPPQRISNQARANVRNIEKPAKAVVSQEEKRKQIEASTEYYKNHAEAKPGSLAAKARMVEQFNEKNKKK